MLLQEYDPNKDAVINPEMLVEKVENFPDVTISCFSKKLFESVLAFFEPKKLWRCAQRSEAIPFTR